MAYGTYTYRWHSIQQYVQAIGHLLFFFMAHVCTKLKFPQSVLHMAGMAMISVTMAASL
jgi:hypothetical protein